VTETKKSRATPRLVLGALVALLVGWSFFHYWTDSKGAYMEPAAVESGKYIYENQCAPCHEAADLHLIKNPPKLDGLFRRSALPSGGPLSDQAVRDVILHGRGIMPPFQQTISQKDLDDLMEYLHTK